MAYLSVALCISGPRQASHPGKWPKQEEMQQGYGLLSSSR